ncbi:hypothetical protein CYMTET_23021 [Cymbomonas tetramitiformis]|uniref:Uncharacterized protein n=1 Tax=Cymbomonas tetramitiformis TaxID=36881 RepID=A0AAE0FZ46_9CHLO|nr:hypothetical protein CYMTET_23021 [Cymbomonas tetramitiformis]
MCEGCGWTQVQGYGGVETALHQFAISRLYSEINPDTSKHRVLKNKVMLTLQKSGKTFEWAYLASTMTPNS